MASKLHEKDGLLQELYKRLGQIVAKIGNWEKPSVVKFFTPKFVKETILGFFVQMACEFAWIFEYLQASKLLMDAV